MRRLFRRNKLALASLLVIAALIATAILAPWIAPYDPNQPDMADTLSLPSTRAPPPDLKNFLAKIRVHLRKIDKSHTRLVKKKDGHPIVWAPLATLASLEARLWVPYKTKYPLALLAFFASGKPSA